MPRATPTRVAILRTALFIAWVAFASSLLLFTILEIWPPLVRRAGLDRYIRYYEITARYRPDPVLVLEPRTLARSGTYSWRGDLYSPAFGVPVAPVEHRTSYDAFGFRTNTSNPPYDVLVVGDSYVETGETDDLTFSELLKQASGLSTYNLGRSWYGPDQYVELFRTFAPIVRPRIAMLCFFGGNDAEDMVMYARWRRGGSYYDFLPADLGFFGRYARAAHDTAAFLARAVLARVRGRFAATRTATRSAASPPRPPSQNRQSGPHEAHEMRRAVHPDLAVVQLGARTVSMRLLYTDLPLTADQLLERREWRHLAGLLETFAAVADRYGIRPVVLFIPTALETYAEQIRDDSGAAFLERYRTQHGFETAQRDALARLSERAGVEFIDLLPEFRRRAAHGALLYYPFDTHWMPSARRAAAALIAPRLKALLAAPALDVPAQAR